MDNDEERLNLREVKAFGRWISTSTSTPSITLHQPILNINADQADDIIESYAESTSWPAAEMPSSWTICSAFKLIDWPSPKDTRLSVWKLYALETNALGEKIVFVNLRVLSLFQQQRVAQCIRPDLNI